jgi:hypothetical protein
MWSESTISETMISDSRTFLCTTISSTSPFPVREYEWGIVMLKFRTHLYAVNSVVSRLKSWKLCYSKMDIEHSDLLPQAAYV